MARFDKVIPPGGEGKIILSVRTKGRNGSINKSAKVYTNDPVKKLVILRIKAFVTGPIYLSSHRIRLYGKEDESVTRFVEVKARLDRPLTLTPGEFNLAEKLTFTIEEIEKGRRFLIHFKSIPGPPQTYNGFLKLTTNYPEKLVMTIWIKGRFLKKS